MGRIMFPKFWGAFILAMCLLSANSPRAISQEGQGEGRVVVQSNHTGNHELYAIDLDGGPIERLTPEMPGDKTLEAVSPDGGWLFFSIYASDDNLYSFYRIGTDGTGFSEIEFPGLARGVEINIFEGWSGRWWIVAAGEANLTTRFFEHHLYRIDPDTLEVKRLTTTPAFTPEAGEPYFFITPDEQSVVYYAPPPDSQGKSLYRVEVASSEITELTPSQSVGYFAGWSADGEWLFYHGGANRSLYRVRLDGTEEQPFWGDWLAYSTLAKPPFESLPDEWVYVAEQRAGDWNLYRVGFETMEIEQLTTMPGSEPIWTVSPDGEWIYFTNLYLDSVTRRKVYRMRPDGSEQTLILADDHIGASVYWLGSGEGQRLLFSTSRNQEEVEYEWFTMQADGSDMQQFGEALVAPSVFQLNTKWVAYLRRGDDGLAENLYVLNLETGEELALMPADNEWVPWAVGWIPDGDSE